MTRPAADKLAGQRMRLPGRLTAWRKRLDAWSAQAKGQWSQLARRERRLVVFCAGLCVVVGGWVLAIEPALQRLDHWQAELPRLRSQLSALDTVLSEAAAPVRPTILAEDELSARLTSSLDAAAAGAYTLVPETSAAGSESAGAPGWRVRFEDAEAAAVMAWLFQAPVELGLVVRNVALTQSAELLPPDTEADVRALAGRVRGDVRLARQASPPSKDSP